MNISCKKCNHQQRFDVEPADYQGYVCPNCHSYFKIDSSNNWTYVDSLKKKDVEQWAKLNEAIVWQGTTYYIITKIQRWTTDDGYSNEYVGLSKDDKEIYWADGSDYACQLNMIDESDITESQVRIKYKDGKNFDFDYSAVQYFKFAEGFVFEDIKKTSSATTYINTINEDRFISKEKFDDKIEYYLGEYIPNDTYFGMFPAYEDYQSKIGTVSSKFNYILIAFILMLASLFYGLQAPYFGTAVYKFDEKFSSKTVINEFVGQSFKIDGRVSKKLVFESISETNIVDLKLVVQLVNETTNEVQSTGVLAHFDNDKNKASGVKIDFCNVSPGNYHIVFVTNGNQADAIDLKLEEDYKITSGGVSYVPVIIALIVLVIMAFYIRSLLLNIKNGQKILEDNFSYFQIVKFKNFGLLFLGIILILFAFIYYQQHASGCKTTEKVNRLEDNTYTGSRAHYFRRTYSDYNGNHK